MNTMVNHMTDPFRGDLGVTGEYIDEFVVVRVSAPWTQTEGSSPSDVPPESLSCVVEEEEVVVRVLQSAASTPAEEEEEVLETLDEVLALDEDEDADNTEYVWQVQNVQEGACTMVGEAGEGSFKAWCS